MRYFEKLTSEAAAGTGIELQPGRVAMLSPVARLKRHLPVVFIPALFWVIFPLFLPKDALAAQGNLTATTDGLWVLIAASLVFLMQAGFTAFESGMVTERDIYSVAYKNFFDWVIVSLAYLAVGFGIHYGASMAGYVGIGFFGLSGYAEDSHRIGGYVFFLYQLVFAGTCATIVSGALTGRSSLQSHFAIAFAIGLFIYPIFGHWVWGSGITGSAGFLEAMGYRDFAGASVVHLMGATISFVGIRMVGPRLGRFDPEGNPVDAGTFVSAPIWGVLGALLLWMGWIGFNGGSTLTAGGGTALAVLNTNTAGAAGAFAAFLHCLYFQNREDLLGKSLGGALGGLVAVTAFAAWTTPLGAALVGLAAGIVHNIAVKLLLRFQMDDPVNAIPVHGACGILGILAMPVLAKGEFIPSSSRLVQLAIQFGGVAACLLFGGLAAWFCWTVIRAVFGLRVSPSMELAGINFAAEDPHVQHAAQVAALDEETLKLLAGGGDETKG